MATRKYYISKGLDGTGTDRVTEAVGSAITGGLLEVTVDLAVTATKREVVKALDNIKRYIIRDGWPPA